MSRLNEVKPRNNFQNSMQYRTEYNNFPNPLNKSDSIYFRDTIKQFCPHQRFVDHRPYPFRSSVLPPIDFNYYNNPTEKDMYVPCFKNYHKREINPLVTREDLAKYIKTGGSLFNHRRPCVSCNRINDGNYGRNYYTYYQKSFPFINGNFCGENFKYTNGLKTPTLSRNNGNVRYRLRGIDHGNYNNYDTNNNFNNNYNNNYDNTNEDENEKKNSAEKDNLKNEKDNEMDTINNKYNTISNYSDYKPKYRRRFHKTQIFNNYKPFMVDDFKEYADYE